MHSIYRSAEGRAALAALYDRRLAQLDVAVDSRYLETRFGKTHLLAAGDDSGTALVLLPGANSNALDMVELLGGQARDRRCLFLDVPGEPARSSEERPGKADDGYARWMEDVLDALELRTVDLFGVSKGAFIALKCGAVIPERLARMVLMMPEGLSRPRLLPFLRRVAWPALRYRLAPGARNGRRFLEALSTPGTTVPEGLAGQMILAFEHVRADTRLAPPFTADDLAALEAPVLIIAGGRDPLFPGDRVARRARAVIPNLDDVVVIPDARHIHFETPNGAVAERVARFLGGPC